MERSVLMYLMTNELIGSLGIAQRFTLESLKKSPFNAELLKRRDNIHFDLERLKYINYTEGMVIMANMEQIYDFKFKFLTELQEKTKIIDPGNPEHLTEA